MAAGAGTRLAAMALTAGLMAGCNGAPGDGESPISFDDLAGWDAADHALAAAAFRRVCAHRGTRCPAVGADAGGDWEDAFQPVQLAGGEDALFTAYYEPVIPAARQPSGRFGVPIHAPPSAEHWADGALPTRADIAAGALAGEELALFWLEDPVDKFFLQIQGSGRLSLPDGSMARVSYAGRNGHPYRSIGALLVARGEVERADLTAESLKDWLRADTARGRALMNENPSYVFFRENRELMPEDGPVGAAGLPLIAGISAAVDPAYYPLGSALWVEVEGPDGPLNRLVIAEDTGSAIKGPDRIDLFFGTGAEAGRAAGALSHHGRIVLLRPLARLADAEEP